MRIRKKLLRFATRNSPLTVILPVDFPHAFFPNRTMLSVAIFERRWKKFDNARDGKAVGRAGRDRFENFVLCRKLIPQIVSIRNIILIVFTTIRQAVVVG